MSSKSKNAQHEDAWDSGELGRSMDHVGVVSDEECRAVDASLGLHPVSIRLEKSLIQQLKLIAEHRGVAYQPLIRDLLNRFVVSELKDIMHEKLEEAVRRAKASGADKGPVADFIDRERKQA
jgi:predicted DNA-binding ribbon-helix-helix protein